MCHKHARKGMKNNFICITSTSIVKAMETYLSMWQSYKHFCTFHKYKRTPRTVRAGSVMWRAFRSIQAACTLCWKCTRAPLVTIKSKGPVSTRRRRARASSASSSSFCGSETRFLLVGHSGPACRTAPSASACWWIRSWEIRFRVRPAAAWSRAFSSSSPSFVPCTTKHLQGRSNQACRLLYGILCSTLQVMWFNKKLILNL